MNFRAYTKNLTEEDRKGKMYIAWYCMMHRCLNPYYRSYKDYGKIGITVCERWKDYLKFREDMGPTYKEGMALALIDTRKGYSPDNAEWSTRQQPNRNRRMIEIDGIEKNVYKWSDDSGVPADIIARRWLAGWRGAQLLQPVR